MVFKIISVAFKLLLDFLELAVLIDIVLSWVYPGGRNTFTDIIHSFTNPLMIPGRKIQEKILPNFIIDFSPIFAIGIIQILRIILNDVLLRIF